jgi:hypothetical protein
VVNENSCFRWINSGLGFLFLHFLYGVSRQFARELASPVSTRRELLGHNIFTVDISCGCNQDSRLERRYFDEVK